MRPFRKTTWKPTLHISETVHNKMKQLVNISSTEISWHGFIEQTGEHDYTWYDIIMFPQYNTGVTTTTEEDEYSAWLDRQVEHPNFKDLRLHGHSHVNMGVTPSATDMTYRENATRNLRSFYFFVIVNKKGEMSIAFYDAEAMLIFENSDINVIIENKGLEKAKDWAEKAIKNNVKEREKPCLTTSNQRNFSTQSRYTPQYMSQVSELWEDPLQKFCAGSDWMK